MSRAGPPPFGDMHLHHLFGGIMQHQSDEINGATTGEQCARSWKKRRQIAGAQQ